MQAHLNKYLKDSRKKDKRPINWDDDASKAFETCRQSLVDVVSLAYPQSNAEICVVTDASDFAMGTALEQQVDGRSFIVATDHKPLIYAHSHAHGSAPSGRLQQMIYLTQFDITHQHLPGWANNVANALSRIVETADVLNLDSISLPSLLDLEKLASLQASDTELPEILQDSTHPLKLVKMPLGAEKIDIYVENRDNNIRPYLPLALSRKVFDSLHAYTHPSIRTMKSLIGEDEPNDDENDNFDYFVEYDYEYISENEILYNNDFYSLIKDFTGLPSHIVKNTPLNGRKPIDYFERIMDDNLLEVIVQETNLYQFQNPTQKPDRQKMKVWKNLGNDELKKFLGLTILMGHVKKVALDDNGSRNPLLDTPIFHQTMPRNRFEQILQFLHFQNNETLLNHPLKKIKTIIDDLNTKFANFLQTGRNLSYEKNHMMYWHD
uniref:Reverse transcriptase/retrotransposon-derived protein RNase H-like domain-containing protein n=1 Tax=Trichogramma kaykai TaxID=54128 RepID=A0ABD2WI95_9HYME